MNLDQQTIETLKWFGVGIGWLISTYITYRIGRKAKHDDIQIGKRHAFAEQLSTILQKDFHDRQLLAAQYHSNFDHRTDLSEAMHDFKKYDTLYEGMRDLMAGLPPAIQELQETNRSAAIYLDEGTTEAIESYLANARFSYESDGIGLINTYAENFFSILLDPSHSTSREKHYKVAMRGLRKAVR